MFKLIVPKLNPQSCYGFSESEENRWTYPKTKPRSFFQLQKEFFLKALKRCRRTKKERRRSWISLPLKSSPNTKALPRSLTVRIYVHTRTQKNLIFDVVYLILALYWLRYCEFSAKALQLVVSECKPKARIVDVCKIGDSFIREWAFIFLFIFSNFVLRYCYCA